MPFPRVVLGIFHGAAGGVHPPGPRLDKVGDRG
jgi:hypothetical protein